ncbi:MAG TPA: hypothetical protein VK028_15690, partial [Micromonosporaceae bacterium]|nr:hypothetical protein [Micromonosporaceae bacterium]
MSEEKPSGGSQPQQSFGSAPGSGEQSFGSAEPAQQPPDAQPPTTAPPPAAPAAPAQPAGDQSFGGAPQPPAPQPPAPQPPTQGETFGEAPPPPPTAPPKKRFGWLRVVGGVILALVLLCLVGAFVLVRFVNADPLRNLSVGDCLADVPTV